MLKKTITYTDYEDLVRTEDFYFNLSKAEIAEMEYSIDGGMKNLLEQIVKSQSTPQIFEMFKMVILKAYGEKSPDGRRFVKSKELSDAFSQTEAYSDLVIEMLSGPNVAAEFINAVIPQIK